MDPLVALLLEKGVIGILAGAGFYLYFRERKLNQKHQEEFVRDQMKHLISDTAAKTKLTVALEDLAETVSALSANSTQGMETCRSSVDAMLKDLQDHLQVQRKRIRDEELKREREKGRQEGRTEVTGRFRVPPGDDDVQD